MAKKVPVNLVITGVDRVSQTMKRITQKFPKLSRQVSRTSTMFAIMQKKTEGVRRSLKKLGNGMKSVGRSMATSMTLPIGLAGGAIIKTAVDFQKSINKVGALTRTIVGGQVSPEFEQLEKLARDLGSTTEFTSVQAADAMSLLGRAGFQVNEIMSSTDDVLALASASGFDLAFSADVMAKTMRQFGIQAEQAGRVTDVLADVSRRSNVDLETIAETFKVAAPIAKTYGATLEQTAAITGLLGDVGLQGSVAGTALKNIFLKLATPSKQGAKFMQQMGVAVTNVDGSMRSAGQILTDIAPKIGKLNKDKQLMVINELFGLRGIAGASALMSKALDEGRNPIAEMTKVLEGSTGAAKDMQKTMLRGAPGALARFQSAVEGAGLAIADSGLLDAFTDILTGLTSLATKLKELSPTILKWGTILAGVAAIMGPVIVFAGFLVSSIGSLITAFSAVSAVIAGAGGVMALLTGPIALVIAGIVALIAIGVAVVKNWESVKEFFMLFWQGPIGSLIKFFTPIGWLIQLAGKVVENWSPISSFFSGIFDSIMSSAGKFFNWILPKLSKVADLLLFGGNKFFSADDKKPKLGEAKGADREQRQISAMRSEPQASGKVDFNFNNLPQGTRVRSEVEGPVNLNLGFANGVQ